MNDTIVTPFIPDEDSPYIFVSYAHADKKIVFPIIKRLYEQGWHIWYDEGLELGEDYYGSLKKHIKNCDLFLLFASLNSMNSFFIVECEIPQAKQFCKEMVVLHLDKDTTQNFQGVENGIHTDDAHIEAVLEHISTLKKAEPRKAVSRTVHKNILTQPQDREYEYEKCSGGVRITGYIANETTIYVPEEYPPLSGVKVVEISDQVFGLHKKSEIIYLPESLKTIDYNVFWRNKNLKELHVPGTVEFTNNFQLPKSFEDFVIHCAKDSSAHIFAKDHGLKFEIEKAMATKCKNEEKPYAYFSFAPEDCTDSFSIFYETVENNCNCIMGLFPEKQRMQSIENCTCFVAIVNKQYMSGYVINELRKAVALKKKIAVYQLEDCELPEDLKDLHMIHQLRYDTGTTEERNIKLINWLTKNKCRDSLEISGFEYTATDEGIQLTRYTETHSRVKIDSYYCEIPVISIKYGCFYKRDFVKHVDLPDTVQEIGDMAFFNCKKLQTVTIPNALSSIGRHAFYGCGNLKSLTLPDSISHIGRGVFSGCDKLESISLPNGIPVAGGVFEGWPNLKHIEIPQSEHEIMESAFSGCSNLTSVTLHDGITNIKGNAFKNCVNLEEIILPEKLEDIGPGAFRGCSNLKKLVIPGDPQFVGSAFYDCKKTTIYCKENSKIYEFCKKHKFSYILL